MVKTWLPIMITIGTMVVGYFVFKVETQHQFEIQSRDQAALAVTVQRLSEDVDRNRREWRAGVITDLNSLDTRIDELEEARIRIVMRLKVLEGRPLDSDD